jgi:predicted enzyme related to lactoylglutathione lyase
MTEIEVSDFDASVAWYRDRLGLRVEVDDAAGRFALLRGPTGGGGLALKGGVPNPAGVRLQFAVVDLNGELGRLRAAGVLPAAPPKDSPEGYRRAVVRDPDGYAVSLFTFNVVTT